MQKTTNGARGTSKKFLGFSAKDRIDHAVFGLGTIIQIDSWRTTITFDDAGTKKFVTSMVQLSPSDTPAPRRRRSRKKQVVPAS